MKRTNIQQAIVFAALVITGVALRVYFQYLPNFAPIAALALFAGFFFRSPAVALAVPLAVMGLSDQLIGGYEGVLMLTVYGMLALPVAMRSILRKRLNLRSGSKLRFVRSVLGLVACSLVASILFFVVTNFATWCVSDLYETTGAGLVRCYLQAIPFFRYTLTGDLAFATLLFGGYALVLNWKTSASKQPAVVSL